MKKSPKLILASQSKARRRLLKRLGIKFLVRPAHLDEEAVARSIRRPRELVLELARQKAASISSRYPQDVVIGSDQVLVFKGRVYGKPGTESKAVRQLKEFSGQWIQLLTAVIIRGPAGEMSFVHETKMKFHSLSPKAVREYVRIDQPLDCAGSFKFECLGISLFEAVQTDDPTAIEGLPLLQVADALRRMGILSR
jgi:septum formation protein